MSDQIAAIKEHLKSHSEQFIEVMNAETEKYIKRKLYLDEIQEKYGSLEGYLTSLLKDGIKKVQVIRRKKRGNTSKPMGMGLNIALAPAESKPETQSTNTGLNSPIQQDMDDNYGQSQYYRDKIYDLKEKIVDLKQEISEQKEEKRELRNKLEECYTELRGLKIEVDNADRKLELELLRKDLDQKSILDSEVVKEGLNGIFTIAGGGGGGRSEAALNAPSYSQKKTAILQLIGLEDVTDAICEKLSGVTIGLLEKEGFADQLQELLITHNLHSTNG